MVEPSITQAPASVLPPLREWVGRCPDKLLYAFLDIDGNITEQYTYQQFWDRTTDIAAHIQRSYAFHPGDRVLLAYPPGLEVICAFFAAVRLGLVPVPVYPPTRHGFASSLQKMNFIADNCSATAILTDRTWYWSMKVNQTRHRLSTFSWSRDTVSKLPWVITTDAARGSEADLVEGQCDTLFLQYTSGSTSDPKGVMVTHANLLANGDAVVDHLPVGVTWLPQYHDMGLIGYYLFFALKGGTTYGFSPIDFIRRPALWLETISKFRGTASSAPNFAYEYCLRPGKLPPETFEGLDLTSLRFLMNAAEPVRPQVVRDFLARFEPHGLDPGSFFSAYGLAEYTLAVSNYGRRMRAFDRDALHGKEVRTAAPGAHDAVTLVSCGKTLGATQIRIVRDGKDLSDRGGVGEVWIDGPSKCQGYFGNPKQTKAVFHAELSSEPDRTWLRSGDLGFLHDGELFLCGRSKDIIIVRGTNYYPQDVELLVEKDRAVRKGCVAAFSHDTGQRERLVVVAEVKDASQVLPDHDQISRLVMNSLGIAVDELIWIQPRTIPKTSSGKIVRHRARQAFLDGTLHVVASIAPDAVDPAVDATVDSSLELGEFGEVLQRYGLTGRETWTLPEAGLDSIQLVEFAQALKDHLQASGHAKLIQAVDVQVLQTIALCELCELLSHLAASRPHAQLRFQRALAELGREHRRLDLELMRRDAKLRFDPSQLPNLGEICSRKLILLTGGTGFFGPFLLAGLLRQTTDDIAVLVRADDEASGLKRLQAGLREMSPDASYPAEWDARIRPVIGDLSRVNLGLTTARWNELAEQVHAIYHNGAWVNYLFDYARLRDVNVGGTNEIIRLAMSHRPAVFNYISTTFVFGWSVKDTLFETDSNHDLDLLDFGYSQSKWVAEQVVFHAMEQGLQARVFRPALITPSVVGGGRNYDISIRLLAFMLQHGLGTTAENQVSFSPADLAADNIVGIAQLPDSVGKTFHVTRDEYASMAEVTAILGELTGRPFAYHSLDDFVPEVIERCRPGDILFPLLEFFVRSIDNITAMEFKRYDNDNFREHRAVCAGQPDPPLRDVVHGMLRFMQRQGIVDHTEEL
jgi:thioester reductase-like protein